MNGHRYCSTWVTRMSENVVTPDDALDHKSRFQQGAYDISAVNDRQTSSGHGYAATVIRRISGGESEGIAIP